MKHPLRLLGAPCLLLFVGCASQGIDRAAVADAAAPLSPSRTSSVEANELAAQATADSPADPAAETTSPEPTNSAPPESIPPPTAAPTGAQAAASEPKGRFTLKGGWFYPSEDGLDDGWIGNLSWMTLFNPHFAMEFEVGYFSAPGAGGTTFDIDSWGIPVMVNGRGILPLGKKVDLYAGLGIGTVYYDVDAIGPGGQDVGGDGWLFAGNGFAGASYDINEKFVVGLEGKYYLTGRTDTFDWNFNSWALMLTVGFNH